jgi:integrase
MKGQFKVISRNHGKAKFVVEGRVNKKRVRTHFRTRAEAEAHCERRNVELFIHGHELASISSAFLAEALQSAKRLEPINFSLTQAADYCLARYDLRAKSVPVAQAWEECFAEFVRKFQAEEISKAHLKTTKKAGQKLAGSFGKNLICDLTPLILSRWLASLKSATTGLPLNVSSRNNTRINLSGIFTYAKFRGWINDNPISAIPAFRDRRVKRPAIVTLQEAAALLENAEPEILPHFAIGLFAGLRVSEIERLDWSEIRFSKKDIWIKAEKSKTAQPRFVEMSDNLIEWLTPHCKAHGPVVPQYGREHFIKRARKAAGILNWGNKKKNALRHSFCSYHLALHQNSALTADQAGHQSSKMLFDYYRELVEKDVAQQYFGIRPEPQAQNILAIG